MGASGVLWLDVRSTLGDGLWLCLIDDDKMSILSAIFPTSKRKGRTVGHKRVTQGYVTHLDGPAGAPGRHKVVGQAVLCT